MTSLEARFDPRRNSLNAIRLALALLVIISHTWPVGGYAGEPHLGEQTLGNWAVDGFFAISGYLIISSRLNSRSLLDFLWRRVLRIYPGFLIALLVIAFVLAPLVTSISGDGSWRFSAATSFVLHNLPLWIKEYGIDGTLVGVPYPHNWIGSLWTLFYEFICYLAVGIGVSLLRKAWIAPVCVALLVGCMCVSLIVETGLVSPVSDTIRIMSRLGAFFAAGSLTYLWRTRIPTSGLFAALAVVLIALTAWLGVSRSLSAPALSYLLMYLGAVLPLHRVGGRNDISYGVYLYGFPVQQALAHTALGTAPALVFAAVAMILTIPFAWGSWLVVERPVMRFKRLLSGAGAAPRRPSSSPSLPEPD